MLFAISSRFFSICPANNTPTAIPSFLLICQSSLTMGCNVFGVILLVAWAEQPPANRTFRLQSFLQYRSLPCHVTVPHQSSESLKGVEGLLLLLLRFSSEDEARPRIVITSSIRNQSSTHLTLPVDVITTVMWHGIESRVPQAVGNISLHP